MSAGSKYRSLSFFNYYPFLFHVRLDLALGEEGVLFLFEGFLPRIPLRLRSTFVVAVFFCSRGNIRQGTSFCTLFFLFIVFRDVG